MWLTNSQGDSRFTPWSDSHSHNPIGVTYPRGMQLPYMYMLHIKEVDNYSDQGMFHSLIPRLSLLKRKREPGNIGGINCGLPATGIWWLQSGNRITWMCGILKAWRKEVTKPSTISSACRLRQLVSTTEGMANLLNEFWTHSSLPSVILMFKIV